MSATERTSLRRDTAWAMAGALAQTASQAAIMLVLADVASTQIVGQYALGLAIATPLNIFADRAIRMLQATASDVDFPLSEYLAVRTLVGIGSLIVTFLLVLVWNLESATGQIVLLVALGRFVEGIAQTLYGRLQRGHQMPQIGQSQVLRGAATAFVSLFFLFTCHRLDCALAASVVANAMVLIALDRGRVACCVANGACETRPTELCVSFQHVGWTKMLRLAIPLAFSTFFVSLSVNLPRLFLSWSASESTLGVFAVLCYFSFPATMLVSAIMQAATPRLADSYRDDPQAHDSRLSRRLLTCCAAIGIGNWFIVRAFGHMLLQWGLGGEYAAAAGQLDWLAAAAGVGFLAAVPATAMNAQRLFRLSLVTCGVSCGVTCLAGTALIPRYGMSGAATTMMLTSGAHLTVSVVALRTVAWRRGITWSGMPTFATERHAA